MEPARTAQLVGVDRLPQREDQRPVESVRIAFANFGMECEEATDRRADDGDRCEQARGERPRRDRDERLGWRRSGREPLG